MAKNGWFDRLLALAHLRNIGPQAEVEGLVLSGGGARASFQIGALRYLYANKLVAPTKIAGTSAGSIIGSMLAQESEPDKQEEQLKLLETYWLGMKDSSDMFAEQAWFTRLKAQWEEIAEVLPERVPEPTAVEADADDPEVAVKEAMKYDPSTDSDFSVSMLWQAISVLPKIGRAGAGIAATVRGAERAASAYRPGSLIYRLLFESGWDKKAVSESGVELRMAFVGLNSGDLHFMRQDGIIVDANDVPLSDQVHDLSLGLWASCAIPGVFRPVKLGGEVYVDGGTRENIPVEMAVAKLGVTKPYVVVASPPGVPWEDYSAKDMVSTMMRTISILMDESNRDEVAWARTAGAVVIEPRVDVHGALTVEPELLKINRDYGWMRAAEEVGGAPTFADELTRVRVELYELGPDAPKGDRARVKARIAALAAEVDPAWLPDDWGAKTPKPSKSGKGGKQESGQAAKTEKA
ncbi:MAG: patatin-like phospholipase family protein [Propionibacteriaceae bacterium]|jgi:predicted acylesterase/phospholipase RssA|nr:patatin-like phospholipase family protein [Propionibacteriaceae bacterium]